MKANKIIFIFLLTFFLVIAGCASDQKLEKCVSSCSESIRADSAKDCRTTCEEIKSQFGDAGLDQAISTSQLYAFPKADARTETLAQPTKETTSNSESITSPTTTPTATAPPTTTIISDSLPSVKTCAGFCIETSRLQGVDSQAIKDECNSACSQAEYYGGSKSLASLTTTYEESVKEWQSKPVTVTQQSTAGAVTVKRCSDLCIEVGKLNGVDSQYMKDECGSACQQVNYYGGEKSLAKVIAEYEKSINEVKVAEIAKLDVESGVYDKEIEQCANWAIENIELSNQMELLRQPNSEYLKVVNFSAEQAACRKRYESGKYNATNIAGKEFKEQIDKNNAILNKAKEECYPYMLEYKLRGGNSTKAIEDEALWNCVSYVQDSNYQALMDNIKTSLANWEAGI